MSEWMSLPFPKCPRCQKFWVKTYHCCSVPGEVLVEPYQRQAKCCGCSEQWFVMNTSFNCSCGYTFSASEVENALSTTQLLKQRLIQKLNEMDSFERSITTKSQSSFKQWIGSISYEIGKLLGTTASQAKQLIDNFFEKWSF